MTDSSPTSRPNVEARRTQILTAATECVRRAGFHGASMADIAQAAGLSVGQIYRYFENKESIVSAIVDLDVAEMREKFSELERSSEPLADAIVTNCSEAVARNYDPDRAALWLEVLAEAARNPRVGEIVRTADIEERAFRMTILQKINPPGCDERQLTARGEVLSMIFEGMVVRGLNNPNSDHEAIAEVLRRVIRSLLVETPCDPA